MESFRRHRFQNVLQTGLLLIGLWLPFFVLVDRFLFSPGATAMLVVFGLVSTWMALRWSGPLVMRRLGAVRLDATSAPGLLTAVDRLAGAAGLDHRPEAFLISSPVPNAFATTWPGGSAIAVTEGLIRRLNGTEFLAVLAHEIAHVRNRDLYVLAMADLAVRMTSGLALFGWLLVLVQLPLLLFGVVLVPPLLLVALLLSPRLVELLRLALSRTREFDADLEAARLTGHPAALASALRRLQGPRRSLWMRLLFPGPDALPNYLRTHPAVEERVRRLQSLTSAGAAGSQGGLHGYWVPSVVDLSVPQSAVRRPRTVWQVFLPPGR